MMTHESITTEELLKECPSCGFAFVTQTLRVSADGENWTERHVHRCSRGGTSARPACPTAIQNPGQPVQFVEQTRPHRGGNFRNKPKT
jgi:hypothetical protein